MQFLFAYAVWMLGLTYVSTEVNYCDIDCNGDEHIGCNNNGEIKSSCPQGASKYVFSDEEIDYILHLHNDCRNAIANGSVAGFETAKRMARSTWSEEFAKLALYNTETCIFQHDDCRNTASYEWVGQNLGARAASNNYPVAKSAIRQIIFDWYDEKKDCNMSFINSFYSQNGVENGHFTQLVNQRNTVMGCGATTYFEDDFYWFYMACNYARINIDDQPIYNTGEPCSACTKKCDNDFPALCEVDEPIDANSFD